jgi:hypothetical protein
MNCFALYVESLQCLPPALTFKKSCVFFQRVSRNKQQAFPYPAIAGSFSFFFFVMDTQYVVCETDERVLKFDECLSVHRR